MIYFEDDDVYHEAARKVFEKTRGLKSSISSNVILTDHEAIKQAQSDIGSSLEDRFMSVKGVSTKDEDKETNNGS